MSKNHIFAQNRGDRLGTRGAIVGSALLAALAAPNQACANEAEEARKEVARQTARQISTTVNARVAEEMTGTGSGGGSGDALASRMIAGFASPTFTGLEDVDSGVDTEIYQMVLGGDTRMTDFIVGVSGSYSRADVNGSVGGAPGGFVDFGLNTYAVTPYAAYLINKNLFVSAMAGYNRTEVEESQSDGNGVFTDISIGYILPVDQFVFSGRLGHRFNYFAQENSMGTAQDLFNFDAGADRDDDAWDNTYYIQGQVDYKWNNLTPYLSGRWEHNDPEDTPAGTDDIDSAFLTAGIDYDVQDAVSVGLHYTTELTGRAEDSDKYYNQAGASLKVRF